MMVKRAKRANSSSSKVKKEAFDEEKVGETIKKHKDAKNWGTLLKKPIVQI